MEDESTIPLDCKSLSNLRVVDLKQELDKRGLSKSGTKKDLIKRLKQQLDFEKLCGDRKHSAGDGDLKLELDEVTEQNEFVQQYLARQQKIYAEQKEVKRLVELEEIQKSSDEREATDEASDSEIVAQSQSPQEFPKCNETPEEKNEAESSVLPEIPQSSTEPIQTDISIHLVPPDDGSQTDSSAMLESHNVMKEKIDVQTPVSPDSSQVISSPEAEHTSSMETSGEISAVPYSLSDIQLPTSPISVPKSSTNNMEDAPIEFQTKKSRALRLSSHRNGVNLDKSINDSQQDSSHHKRESVHIAVELESVKVNENLNKVEIGTADQPPDNEESSRESSDNGLNKCSFVVTSTNQEVALKETVIEGHKSRKYSRRETINTPETESKLPEVIKTSEFEKEKVSRHSRDKNEDPVRNVKAKKESRHSRSKKHHSDTDEEIEDSRHSKNRKKSSRNEEKEDESRHSRSKSSKSRKKVSGRDEEMDDNSRHSRSKKKESNREVEEGSRHSKDTKIDSVRDEDMHESSKHSRSRKKQSDRCEEMEEGSRHTRNRKEDSFVDEEKDISRDETVEESKHSKDGIEKECINTQEREIVKKDPDQEERSRNVAKYDKKSKELHKKDRAKSKLHGNSSESSEESVKESSIPIEEKISQPEMKDELIIFAKNSLKRKGNLDNESDKPFESKKHVPEEKLGKESRLQSENKGSRDKKEVSIQDEKVSKLKTSMSENSKTSTELVQKSKTQLSCSGEDPGKNDELSVTPLEEPIKRGNKVTDKTETLEAANVHKEFRSHSRVRSSSSSGDSTSEEMEDSKRKISRRHRPESKFVKDATTVIAAIPPVEAKTPTPQEVPSRQRLKIKRDNVIVSRKISTDSSHSKKDMPKESQSITDAASMPSKSSVEPKESIVISEPVTIPKYTSRKIALSSRKRTSVDEQPQIKKGKWGNITTQKKSQSLSISSDSLKNWFPDLKLVSTPLPEEEPTTPTLLPEPQPLTDIPSTEAEPVPNVVPMTEETEVPKETEDKENEGETSPVILVQNLVRPFTLGQLKELLRQSGRFIEDKFWIDKIKSKCIVTYETEDEALQTRLALHNTRWPPSNPKILNVRFSSEEELELSRTGGDIPKPVVPEPQPHVPTELPRPQERREDHPSEEAPRKRERKPREHPIREWDRDKILQESPERESRSKREERKEKKRGAVETPAKLLDDLFQKTKSTPCIYWLPLTEEKIVERDASIKLQREEIEKRRKDQPRQAVPRSRSPVSRRR